MVTTVFLRALLLLGGLGGGATTDLQGNGKSIHCDKTAQSAEDGRHTLRRLPHPQAKCETHRSLDLQSLNHQVMVTTSQINLPIITKLLPPTLQPSHMHINMPMRFGRQDDPDGGSPNLPQRFGRRSWKLGRVCAKCPNLPQRFGRNSLYWSLLKTLATEQTEDFDFASSSKEVEMEDQLFTA